MTDRKTWDVIVTMPSRIVTIGPAPSEHHAALWATRLQQQLTGTAHPDGTEITTAPHTSDCDHPDAYETHPCEPDGIAEILRGTSDDDDPEARFPDLYARLSMIHGAYAAPAWSAACAALDNEAEIRDGVRELADLVADAERAVSHATAVLTRLRSNQVYDIELAEGGDGADMLHELDAAARALRNAARVAQWRRNLERA